MPNPAAPPAPVHDQAFFLALARQGKDAWNAWRRDAANDGVRVTFEGVDFGVAPYDEISFEGFEFGRRADFSRCKWRGVDHLQARISAGGFVPGHAYFSGAAFDFDARFDGAIFGDRARFDDTRFDDGANFKNTTFGRLAHFEEAKFGHAAHFEHAIFGDGASFDGASFGDLARFCRSIFDSETSFDDTTFGAFADFDGATLGFETHFDGATFGHYALFTGAIFKDSVSFRTARFQGEIDFSGSSALPSLDRLRQRRQGTDMRKWNRDEEEDVRTKEIEGFGPDRFLGLDFSDAIFTGDATFARRAFEREANFTGVRFLMPPDFTGAANTANIDFTGATVRFNGDERRWRRHGWTTDTNVPIRLRAFRAIAETTRNHDLERDLYIEERKAERGVYVVHHLGEIIPALKDHGYWAMLAALFALFVHLLWIVVMGLYWLLSNYGRSFVLPLSWLFASVGAYRWLYFQAFKISLAQARDSGVLTLEQARNYKAALRSVSLSNALPFIGSLTVDTDIKRFLFCALDGAEKLKACVPTPPAVYQWLALSQNLISITLVFFLGLALRNYFRLK